MERAIDVSSDGHASMPATLWGTTWSASTSRTCHRQDKSPTSITVVWVVNGATLSPGILRHDALLIAAATEETMPKCAGGISG
jgi:hypothetical protein